MSKSMKNKSKMKFAELAAQWLASMTHGVKESTLAHYRYTLSRYLLPVFGGYQISLLDAQQLEQGLLQVIAPADGSHMPLGASSSRECLTMLRRICKYGAHLQLMKLVEICIKLPQMEQNAPKPLSSKEQAAVQDLCCSIQPHEKWDFCCRCSWGCGSAKFVGCNGEISTLGRVR